MANLPDNPQPESTFAEIIRKLDELTAEVEKIAVDMKQFDQRFADYRQATQWVVQLAFTLIASATLTVILTSVFNK